MKTPRARMCLVLILVLFAWPVCGAEPLDKPEIVRAGMTAAGAAIGLGAGAAIALGFSLDAIDTPLSDMLLLTIPVAALGAATGALSGRWMADVALTHEPSPLFSVIEGAGLGLLSGAFVGGLTFALNFVIAYPTLEVPEGYWGRFDVLPTVGLALAAGGFWGGFWGLLVGAGAVPVISLYMGF